MGVRCKARCSPFSAIRASEGFESEAGLLNSASGAKGKRMLQQIRDSRSRLGEFFVCLFIIIALAGCNGDGNGSSAGASAAGLSIGGSPTTQVQPDQAYSFTPTVSSGRSTSIGFSVENKPSWASFNIATGQLAGTPAAANIGTYANVVISVGNGTSSAALPGFTINVTEGGVATLAWQAPTANTNYTPLTDLAGYIINYGHSASALSQSVKIGSATTTSYTVDNLAPGTWYFVVLAYTSEGAESSLSNLVSTTIQ